VVVDFRIFPMVEVEVAIPRLAREEKEEEEPEGNLYQLNNE
jgi:hypothetical protein